MRKLTLLLTVAVIATTAGCGFITGDEALTFSADPATVDEDALSESGYEEVSTDRQTIVRNFTVAGQTRSVNVTNHLAQYDRGVELPGIGQQRAGLFVTFASPQVEIATRTFNPIADLSNRQLLAQFSSQYEGLTVGEQVDNRTTMVLGQDAAIEKYEGSAQLSGTSVDVSIHVTTVRHEGDIIVALGIYPQALSGEEERVFTLLDGIEHEGSSS